MAFEVRGNNKTEGNNNTNTVDFEALNKYVVETAGLQEEETVIGIISGIIDLGEQPQEDAMFEWKGSEEDEREEIANNPHTYFENIGDKRYKRWPVKPVQSIAITVDFPEILVDKNKFFTGEENPLPLRLCMNGTFWRKHQKLMDLGRIFSLALRKNDKTNNEWSIPHNSVIYKMAVGSKVISSGEPFTPEMIPNLLGKALLFKVRIFFNDAGFYTERISYAAGLMKGQKAPEYDDSLLFSIGFMSDNDDKDVSFLTKPMINRMSMSTEWEGSKIKEQIERVKGYTFEDKRGDDDETVEDNSPQNEPEIDEEDIPF